MKPISFCCSCLCTLCVEVLWAGSKTERRQKHLFNSCPPFPLLPALLSLPAGNRDGHRTLISRTMELRAIIQRGADKGVVWHSPDLQPTQINAVAIESCVTIPKAPLLKQVGPALQRKDELTVENFLLWTTGYALIVDCVCLPGICKPCRTYFTTANHDFLRIPLFIWEVKFSSAGFIPRCIWELPAKDGWARNSNPGKENSFAEQLGYHLIYLWKIGTPDFQGLFCEKISHCELLLQFWGSVRL